MWLGIGYRKTIKTVLQFPALILMPVWTFWIIGPRSQFSTSKCSFKLGNNDKKLVVSFFWTWINVCLTLLLQLIFFFIFVLPTLSDEYEPIDMLRIVLCCIPWFLMILSIILLIVLQWLNRCKERIPSCCGNPIKMTMYNPDKVQCITYLE